MSDVKVNFNVSDGGRASYTSKLNGVSSLLGISMTQAKIANTNSMCFS